MDDDAKFALIAWGCVVGIPLLLWLVAFVTLTATSSGDRD